MPIAFKEVGIFSGVNGEDGVLQNPTSLQFGPDGRLYVSEQNGSINAFTVSIEDGRYIATSHEEIADANGDEIVKSIQNHFDDGSEKGNVNRQVTGIVVAGTEEEPILYVSSSDPSISSNGDVNLDTNSGVVTRASFDSATGEWVVVDLVRGLPRSEENHAVNGMVLSEDGTELLLMVGGFTNNGAPSSFFSYTAEYALSGALLALDLVALEALPDQTDPQGGQNDTPRAYKYDLPTLDDPNVENVTDGVGEDEFGMDESGPWGGNDGLNQAILPADAPLRIYADGFRNAFDIARTPDGQLFTVDNGSNNNLGDAPNTEVGDADGDGVPGEAINTPNQGGSGEGEPLFAIQEGGYYEHANPTRSNQNASWTVYNDDGVADTSLAVSFVENISALVPEGLQIEDGYLIDPSKFATAPGQTLADLSQEEREARLLLSGQKQDRDTSDQPLAVVGSSTNGVAVYDSGGTAFGGSIDGKLFVTQFNDNVTLLNINEDGDGLDPILSEGADGIYGTADDVVQQGGADGILTVANNSIGIALSNPLDVVVGPDGTLWVAEIGSGEITVLAPAEAILGGDTDGDNDGILNKDDPFMRDATNGASVVVVPGQEFLWDFDANQDDNRPGPDGFGGGLTGVQINGETDFEEFLQSDSPRDAQDIQLDNVKFITAAGGGTTVIEEVSNGDAFRDQNNGEFLFQTGVTLAENVGTVSFEWTVINPVTNEASGITGNFQQIGGQIGTGDQSNYLKIVAIQNGDTTSGIQIALEDDDIVISTQTLTDPDINVFDADDIPQTGRIFLTLDVDVIAGMATPTATYETNSGEKTLTGAVIDLSGTGVLEAIRGEHTVQGQESGLAVGLYSSNTGEPTANAFQAVFDDIRINATEAELPPTAVDDMVSARINETIVIPVSALLANDTDPNSDTLSVTAVTSGANGTASLDDNGTAGDASDDFVTFTPDTDFQGQADFGYTISDGTATDDADVTVNVADTTVLYRVNAGGAEIAALADDPFGSTLAWAANTGTGAQAGDGFSNNTGNISTHATTGRATAGENALPDYVPQGVFAQERWDPNSGPELTFSFGENMLADGIYTVNLFMANGFSGTSSPGQRVFDIEIEGEDAFTGIDLAAILGNQVGGVFTWTGQVSDGTLDIEWLRDVENPLINAIEVIGGVPEVQPELLEVSIVSDAAQVVGEEDGVVRVSILTDRTVPISETVSLVYQIEGLTAIPGADYAPDASLNGSGTAVFTGNATIAGGSSDVQIPISILQDLNVEADESFTFTIVSVSPNAQLGSVSQATITIEDDDAPDVPGEVLVRINAGGAEVASTDTGPNWSADQASVVAGSAVAGTASEFLVDRNIDGTSVNTSDDVAFADATPTGPGTNTTGAPDALFTVERFSAQANPDNIGYSFDLPNGTYTVNLFFDELFFSAAGERIFDVAIEDVTVLENFDTFATYGNDTGQESFDVTVTDGQLNLEFLKGTVNNPHIAAIEIVSAEPGSYEPPVDTLFGTQVEISNDRLAPTDAGVLMDGDNFVSATQEGENGTNGVRDRDYFTFEVPEGKILTGIFLDDFVNANAGSPDGFIGLQQGDMLTVDPVNGQPDEGADGLLGAVLYGFGDVGTNLLDRMADGGVVDPATSFTLPGFDFALTGELTIWLNQGAGPGTPTLRFVVDDDPDAQVPGAFQPNADGNFIFEAEDGENNGAGGFEVRDASDLEAGHDAPSGGEYLETTGNFFGGGSAGDGETLSYKFTAAEDGFIRVNLVSSYQGTEPTEENDAWTKIQLDGVDIAALDQNVPLEPFNGFYKTYQSGGASTSFTLANRNVDNNPQPIVIPVMADRTYDFLLSERSAGFEIDKIALEFFEDVPSGFGSFNDLNNQALSVQVPVEQVGEAVLTINNNSDDIEVSNFGNGSFTITNTGTKDIEFIELDVTDALLPDSVFDPFGLAGDLTSKQLTLQNGSDGGTGLVIVGENFDEAAEGITYLGAGGINGFERIRLDFSDFNAGETFSFGLDMDANSIAGAQKSTLDSGAALAGAGGNNEWDVGGVSGAELIGSTFTVGYDDDTTATGQLQGQGPGQQSGATAVASQASEGLSVTLDVNGTAAGGEGVYGPEGPIVTIQGDAGEVARIVLAKGFIAPFENNFPDDPDNPNEYHDQLDAQLATLAASGFPANNVVEFQYVDITLDGSVQDVSSFFDFIDVAAFDLSTVGLVEAQLPLGFAASVIDPITEQALGPVTSPIHLTFRTNEAPVITDPGAQAIDEGAAVSLQIEATDPDGNAPLSYTLEVLDPDGLPVAGGTLTIDPATGLITGNAPLVLDQTVLTARVTVTDAEGEISSLDVPITVADTLSDADLSLIKTVSDATPAFGDTVTFEITVANAGGDDAGGVVVQDLLPNGFAFTGAAASAGTYDETTGLWNVGNVGADGSQTLTITATVLETPAPTTDTVLYRVNAGGSAQGSEDGSSPGWTVVATTGVTLTGGTAFGNNNTIGNGTVPDDIDLTMVTQTPVTESVLRTEVFGDQSWDFDVEAGDYTVNLYFAEIFVGVQGSGASNGVGGRQFDVQIEGITVLDDYDIFDVAGGGRIGLVESFDVTSDGILDIDFVTEVDQAKISGIEIIQKGSSTTLDYVNFAELFAADVSDPDSTPGNGPSGEDDEAFATVVPTAIGQNAVTVALAVDGNAAEPADNGQYVVSLEQAATTDTIVTYTVGGTAEAGIDYVALSGSVTILAGDISAVIDLTVLDDDFVEESEDVTVTLITATGDANIILGTATMAASTITSEDVPPLEGSALFEVTQGSDLGASTFSGDNAFQITNTSGAAITNVRIDLSTGILPDMVFDPTGAGGDATARGFSPNAESAAVTGLVPVADPDVDPFSQPRNGGFDVLEFAFTDFQQGETFTFSVDIDPNSIQGVPGSGSAGSVSGYELTGATLSVTFDDGTTQGVAVGTIYEDGSLGGGQGLVGTGIVSTALTFAPPVIELVDGGLDVSSLPGDQVNVIDGETDQVVRVTGEPGSTVSLLQMDARLFIASGAAPFDVAADEADFYANEATAGRTLYTAVLDAMGVAEIPVTLLSTSSADTGPDGGLNHFVAVLSDGPYVPGTAVSQTSAVLVVREAPAVEVALAVIADGGEPAENGQFEVSLAEVSTVDTIVTYTVQPGSTATSGTDYAALPGSVTIAAGTLSATIDVTVLDDFEIEADETVILALDGVTQSNGLAILGGSITATVSIVSDDMIDNTAPEITSPAAIDYVEGAADPIFTATATDADGDDVNFALGGVDVDAFEIDPETGTVSFVATPEFEATGDNAFEVTLTASDGTVSVDQQIIVTILQDSDDDLVADNADNAIFVFNPNQRDSDGDGYGNVVDADLNNDGSVGIADLGLFRVSFGDSQEITPTDPGLDADLDGDGSVGLSDLGIFRSLFGAAPGPSFVDDVI